MLHSVKNTFQNIGTSADQTQNGIQTHIVSVAQLTVVVALALSVMAAPAGATEEGAAHEGDVEAHAQGQTQASVSGLSSMMVSVQNRLTAVQERLVSIEARLADLEAAVAANAQQNADATTDSETSADQDTDSSTQNEADASTDVDAAADANVEHSVDTETNGAATVEHRVEKDGETLVDFVINGLFGQSEQNLSITLDGDVEAGNTVAVNVTDHDDEDVANATVRVNGEVVGQTDADGQLTFEVPDTARLNIIVRDGDRGATAHYDVGTEAESTMEFRGSDEASADARHESNADASSGTEEDDGANGDNSGETQGDTESESSGSAEASASVHAEAALGLS